MANDLCPDDSLVDSYEAWTDHYRWYSQHPLRRRSRYTLKADPRRSFQPQGADGSLIDVVPLLLDQDISLAGLRAGMHAGIGSQPTTIPLAAGAAIQDTLEHAPVTLTGGELREIRIHHPGLASADPAGNAPESQIATPAGCCTHCGR